MKESAKLTLYHASSSGTGQKQWSIWLDGKTVIVQWGKVGCKMQTSADTAKPKGKLGTAAYMTDDDCAVFNMNRQIRKKREEGYLEANETQVPRTMFDGLDKQFVPAKPRNDLDVDTLLQLDLDQKIWVQRKRDGQRHLVLITKTGAVKIYSRRMDDMTQHFPLLCQEIKELKLPKMTILDGEVIIDQNGVDNFRAVGTITRAKPEKAAAREAVFARELRYMVFDCLYFAGKPVWEKPYEYRYNEILCNYIPEDGVVFYPQVIDAPLGVTMERAKAEGWEGLVCWFADDPTVVRNGGKPKRAGCAKWKPKQERDFIAVGYYCGSGEMSDVVGGIILQEYAPDGTLRSCGNAGCFKGDSIIRTEALDWEFPCVVSIEFDHQEPEGKLRFPVVLKKHEDKTPDECIGPELDGDE